MSESITANTSHAAIIVVGGSNSISTPVIVGIIIGSIVLFLSILACLICMGMPWRRIWWRVKPAGTSKGVRELELRYIRNRQEQALSYDVEAAQTDVAQVEVAEVDRHSDTQDGKDRKRWSRMHIHIKEFLGNFSLKRSAPPASS